jgi:hypothetical protein
VTRIGFSGIPGITLRHAMHSREGAAEAEFQIDRGVRAWAVERRDVTHTGEPGRRQTTIVFGTCRSDALRRAKAPGRLCEAHHGTDWRVAPIDVDWDAYFDWPLT